MDKISTNSKDVIILGAGAAGLMCAIEAGKQGRQVLVVEHNDRVGRKIRISGGGRCNFTNRHAQPENYICDNPHFVKSALSQFTPEDICAFMRRHHIRFHEKKLGQLFCDESAQLVINALKEECLHYGVQIDTHTTITHVRPDDHGFKLRTNKKDLTTSKLVVATGGLSLPTLGASNFGLKIAQQFDIPLRPCRPGLVPLTFQGPILKMCQALAGVSLDVRVQCGGRAFREHLLFTHRGLSGPAILQISSYWEKGQTLHINLLPNHILEETLRSEASKKIMLKTLLARFWPKRFADIFCHTYLENKSLNQYTPKEIKTLSTLIHHWPLTPHNTAGYAKAEVTVGGIDTTALSSKTMEVHKVPGLYFIGEVVDVTGQLGGFNFQWAWASGFCAGQTT